jgi:hypothetical protein
MIEFGIALVVALEVSNLSYVKDNVPSYFFEYHYEDQYEKTLA